nr:GATA zinc finger domain-containing protein 14-like [Parasteatoda tepidariorum]
MNLITFASRTFLYCVVLRVALSSTFSIQKETQYDFNNLKHKTLHHNNETDNDDKRNNDKYLHKNVDEIWGQNEIPTLKHNSVKIKNGTSNNNTEALDYADELFSYHRLLSESSNRILQTYESDSKRKELVNRNGKIPTDIVKKLGDAVIDLSLEDQDKVIYIPVYEQENPGNYNSVPNQKKIKQNNENQYKKAEIGKKIVGFIGVVLVGKNKDKNSASGGKHMPPTENMKSVHQQHQIPFPNNYQHLSLGLANNHNGHMKSVHQQHQTPSPNNYQHSSPGLTNNYNGHVKSVHQQHQTPSPNNYQHSSPGLRNNHNGQMKSVPQQHQTPSPNSYQHSSLGLTNNHNGHRNSVNDVKNTWNIPISEDQGWKISLVTPNSHGITTSHGLTAKDQVIWGSRHQESSKKGLRNLVPGQNVQLNQKKNMDNIMNTNFNSKLNVPNNRPIPENPLFPNRMRGNRMRGKSLNSPSMGHGMTTNNKKQYQTHKPQINSQNFDKNKNQFKSHGFQMKSQNNDQIKTHMLDGKRTNVFESKNADKSYQQFQYGLLPQQYSSNMQNAQDTDIDKAFKAAGIYLNNQNNVGVQSRSFTPENVRFDSDPRYFHHRSEEINKNSDNIRPTTDQRYNALFHERNNNFNVAKMATIPTYREQNIKHRIPKFYSNFTYMNNIGSTNTNFSGKSLEVENGQFVTLPLDENSWKVIKKNNNSYELERTIPDSISKTAPFAFNAQNNDQFHQQSFQNSPPNHGISPEYFDVKSAVFNGQQIKFLNNDMDLNPLYNSKEIYKIPSDRIRKQFPELKTNKQTEEALLFSGFNNGGWIPSKTDDNNQKDRDLQQFSGAEKRVTDGNSKSESNLSRFTGKNKFNYDNSINARIKNNNNEKNGELKNNSDKSEKKNVSNNSEVDGADPNGFGGESFW